MKIDIEKRGNIPPQIEHYILKMAKRLEKYTGEEGSMKYVISHQRGNFSVEITLQEGGNTFLSRASSNDIKLSINEGLRKLEHQFKRFREKVIERKKISPKVLEGEKSSENPIVKIRRIKPLLLFLDEAIGELNNSKEPFLVFINKETNKQSIIHKKTDNYEVIEC